MHLTFDTNVLKHFDSFMKGYEFIAYPFDKINRKIFLGQNIGHCRFC